jgi:transcriptional regulator with XRE-family HTH domain
MVMDMTVGSRLKRWRRAKGWSQREAADRAGMSQSVWQGIEAGRWKRLGGLQVARLIAFCGLFTFEDFFPIPRGHRKAS